MTNNKEKTMQHTDLNAALCAVKSAMKVPELRRANAGSFKFDFLADADLMQAVRQAMADNGVVCELRNVHGYALKSGTASGLFEFHFTASGCDGSRVMMVPAAGSNRDDGKAASVATTNARKYAYRLIFDVGTKEESDADDVDSADLRRKHEEAVAPRVPQLTGADVYTAFTRRGKDSRSGWTFRTFLHLLKLHGFPATDKIEEDPDSAAAALRRAIGASPWGSEEWSKVNLLLCDHDPESAFGLAGDPDPLHSFKRLTGASND